MDEEFIKELNEFLGKCSKEEQDIGVLNCQIFCMQKSLDMKQKQLEAEYAEVDGLKQEVSRLKAVQSRIEHDSPAKWQTWAGELAKCPSCGYEYCDKLEASNYCGNCGKRLTWD